MEGVLSLFSLAGQTAIVTGGTRGLGQAMAIGFAEAGADIILLQRDTSNLETKEKVEGLGKKAHIFKCDFLDPQSISNVLPAILKEGLKPTILLNSHGIQARHPAAEFPDAEYQSVIQVNLNSVFTLCRDFGAYLLTQPKDEYGRRGSIINIASIMSYQGGIYVAAYATSKGGVAMLTKALSNEWAKEGIAVNAVAPGYVQTSLTEALVKDPVRGPQILDRIPVGRWGKPEDFKGVAVFLASRASRYVSGAIMDVDGGWLGR